MIQYEDRFRLRLTLYRDTRISQKVCTMTCKKRAIPSLHRDSLMAKVRGLYPDAASGNATSLYCRAVIANESLPRLKFTDLTMSKKIAILLTLTIWILTYCKTSNKIH